MEFKGTLLTIWLFSFGITLIVGDASVWEEPEHDDNRTRWEINTEKKLLAVDINENVQYEIILTYIVSNDKQLEIGTFFMGNQLILGPKISKINEKWALIASKPQDFESGNVKFFFEVLVNGISHLIFLTIINIDDNPPQIKGPATCQIEEEKAGPSDCKYTVTDADGPEFMKYIKVDIVDDSSSDNITEYFDLITTPSKDSIEVIINVKQKLDYEKMTTYFFSLRAQDTVQAVELPVIVGVIDIADTPPMWTSLIATKSFDEEQELPDFFQVIAVDGDRKINSPIEYRLKINTEDEELTGKIEINSKTGYITVHKIDRDVLKADLVDFMVFAKEVLIPYMESNATITFIIQDIDDNFAKIGKKYYEFSMPETTNKILSEKIEINDIDLGENSRCEVSLEDAQTKYIGSRKFEALQIIPKIGYQEWNASISVLDASLLDYENPEMRDFTLEIVAKGKKGEGERSSLHILLINRNDEIPIFSESNYEFKHFENITKDTFIGQVYAHDNDVDDYVNYTIVGTSMASSLIISQDGKITTKKDKVLDYEKLQEVLIQIEAKDNLNGDTEPLHTVYTSVTIKVLDVNDEPPKIVLDKDMELVEENTPAGTEIVRDKTLITAEDPDTEAYLEFEIDWDNTWASKQGTKADPKHFRECLEIITHPIQSTQDFSYKVPDVRRSVYAELIVKEITVPGEDPITLDYEKYEFLYLKIVVVDKNTESGKDRDTATLTIPIKDLNDNTPKFVESTLTTEKSVTETDSAQQQIFIGQIAATDDDGPGYNEVFYSLNPIEDTPHDIIKINTNSGQLYVETGTKIDADTNYRYNYTYEVVASDKENQATAKITIKIIDTNNKVPELKSTTNLSDKHLDEDAGTTKLGQIESFDADRDELFHTIAFSINDGIDPNLPKLFSIDRVNGTVFFNCDTTLQNKCLDRDGTNGKNGIDKYVVWILMEDNNGTGLPNKFDKISFNLLVDDINDNAPELQAVTLEPQAEDAKMGAKLGKIEAIDIDEPGNLNSKIEFGIADIYRKDENEDIIKIETDLISIDSSTGELVTKMSLRGYHGEIIIEIKVQDHGSPPMVGNQRNYTFSVTKFNFENPEFIFPDGLNPIVLKKTQTDLNKLHTLNDAVLPKIKATDKQEEKYTITFEIVGEEPMGGGSETRDNSKLFKIGNQGPGSVADLQLTRNRDDTDPMRYKVTMKGEHEGKGNGTNTVEISVEIQFIDQDEEPFFDYDNEINTIFTENTTIESFPIQPALDLKNNDIYYYLYKSENEFFKVNQQSGELGLLNPLDREEKDYHLVIIRASSSPEEVSSNVKNPKSLLHINITVEDINDNPPKFIKDTFVGGMSEKDESNKLITTLEATDPDIIDIGKLIFRMVPNSITVSDKSLDGVKDIAFTTSENGEVRAGFKPQGDMKGYFKFTVEVQDSAPQNYTAKASVKISIISDAIRVTFQFRNSVDTIKDNRYAIQDAFTEIIGYECVADDINPANDESGAGLENETKMKAHFMKGDEPVEKEIIIQRATDLDNIVKLRIKFKEIGLDFSEVPKDVQPNDSLEDKLQILKIILIVVSVVMGILCIGLIVGCIIRVRSLTRRLDAMNVPIFGSNNSGLNRMGGGISAPGTNKHAVDANPVWNTDLKEQSMDNISQGSGDSDLIGIEDSENFAGFNQNASFNPVLRNEMQKKSLNPMATLQDDEEVDVDDIFA